MMATTPINAGDADLARLAERAVAENSAAGRMLAFAESCTGGMVAAAITDVPGSSAVLAASLVTYSNEAKMALLGVSSDILETFGAVSLVCAWAMADGALRATGADVAVAVSGIAGPGGGTSAKPVGTVVFCRARKGESPEQCFSVMRNFPPDAGRDHIRRLASAYALELSLPASDGLHDAP